MSKRPETSRAQGLAEQRGRLLERIAQQRSVLQEQWQPVANTADKGDRALAALHSARQYVQAHRATFTLALAVGCVAFVLVKPGRSWRLAASGFVLWRSWRTAQSVQSATPRSLWGMAFDLLRRRFLPTAFR